MKATAGRQQPDAREREALAKIERVRAMPARFRDENVTMAHGAGGKATRSLIEGLLVPAFQSDELNMLDDAGRISIGDLGLALTTDSFVVKPLRFPGGSIGELAVNGSVNDLAVCGARPLALTLSLVLEEGLPATTLRQEVEAIARAARAAGVEIIAGDTKVVERGHADGMYICTTGLGRVDARANLSPRSLRPGDRILVSGRVGDHGTAILMARGEFELDAPITSDTRSLWPCVDALLDAAGPALRCMRDATRGGIASVLNELAAASGVSVLVREGAVPVHPAVAGACEILGIDPMYVANEGKLIAVVAADAADAALAALRASPGGEEAAAIGEVQATPPGMVLVQSGFGGRRVMDLLVGDPLPRIC
jgi:hydrogenase expression/formation protein HypE